MEKKEYTYEDICKDIKEHKFAPLYVLMGEEPFFIDQITDLIVENAIPTDARDFNMSIFYGADANTNQVIDAARRFPMMSEIQLVVIKEAQMMNKLEELADYIKKPNPTTILVINHKNKSLDRRKAFTAALLKAGIVFESKKIADARMPAYITTAASQRGMTIDTKSSQMLADYTGNDLQTLHKDLDKLAIILERESSKRITSELIETNIGISKDYNNFELLKAIIAKDVLKANRIIKIFNSNPKANPIQPTLAVLFNYFSNLLICFYSKDKSPAGIATALGLRGTYQANDYIQGMKSIGAMKAFQMIHEIRTTDARSKGVDNPSTDNGELMKALLYKMLH